MFYFVKIKLLIKELYKMNKIGPRIKEIRESQKITQEQLVARCNLIEWNISRSTLAKIESQVRRVTDIEIILVAKALKVNISDLFLGF